MFHIIIFSNILLYFVIFVFLFVARTDPTSSCEQLRSFPADVDNQGSMREISEGETKVVTAGGLFQIVKVKVRARRGKKK